jgi:hypothetical protein
MWADSGYDGAPLARYETGQPPAKRWGGERTTAGQPHQAAGSPLSTGFKPVDEHLERPARQCLSREIPFVVRVDEPKGRLERTSTGRREQCFTHCRISYTGMSTALVPPN